MVFFTCNACGEALKKASVESHYTTQCRRCEMLSCVDCGKDFWGEDYKQHNKCITEEEKYSGKNFVPTKVEGKKQHSWTEQVAGAIEKGLTRSHLKKYLTPLQQLDNIPRKKSKFENFMKNTAKLYNIEIVDEIWGLISEQAQKKPEPTSTDPQSNEVSTETKVNATSEKESGEEEVAPEKEAAPKKKKLKKTKDASQSESNAESKKRKAEEVNESPKAKKSKKNKEAPESETNGSVTGDDEAEDKFKWRAVITEAFNGKADKEMTIKKLRKRVIGKYLLQNKEAAASEKLIAKFNKKLSKHKTVTVEGKKVKLVTT